MGISHEINNPPSLLKSNHKTFARYLNSVRKAWEDAKSSTGTALDESGRRRDLQYAFAIRDYY